MSVRVELGIFLSQEEKDQCVTHEDRLAFLRRRIPEDITFELLPTDGEELILKAIGGPRKTKKVITAARVADAAQEFTFDTEQLAEICERAALLRDIWRTITEILDTHLARRRQTGAPT